MTITNHIEINGTVRDFETLTKEEREEIAVLLSDRFMAAAGYQRMKGERDEKGNRSIQPQKGSAPGNAVEKENGGAERESQISGIAV